jgi:hypothetical protein
MTSQINHYVQIDEEKIQMLTILHDIKLFPIDVCGTRRLHGTARTQTPSNLYQVPASLNGSQRWSQAKVELRLGQIRLVSEDRCILQQNSQHQKCSESSIKQWPYARNASETTGKQRQFNGVTGGCCLLT